MANGGGPAENQNSIAHHPALSGRSAKICGTPLSFRSQAMSGFMHVYVAAMEEPESFEPQLHVAIEEKLCWLELGDELPKRSGPAYL